jgi:succinoglycan biosynthesis transport protein ExoP
MHACYPDRNTMPGRERGISAVGPGVLSASDDLFQIVWRSRWLMLVSVAGALAAGFVYLRTATPIYTSTSKLYVQQNIPPFPQAEQTGPYRYNLYTQAARLRSTPILSAALNVPGLRAMQTFAGTDNPLGYLEHRVEVAVGKNDDVITISLGCPYPVEAAEIVNGIVATFMTDHEENKRKTWTDAFEGLQKQKEQKEQRLREKREALAKMKKANALLTMELDQGGIVTRELQSLSAAVAEAKLNTVSAATFYQGVQARASNAGELRLYVYPPGTTGSIDPATGQRVALLDSLFQLQLKRKSLLNSDLTTNHPQVRALDDEMQQIQIRVEEVDSEFVRTQLASAQQRYDDAKKKERETTGLFEDLQRRVAELNVQLVDYRLLEAETEQWAQDLTTLQQQIGRMLLADDLKYEPLKIGILESARPAASPSEPQKSKVLALALALGLLLGGGLAVVRDWLDQTLRSADEIAAALGLSVLGIVPAMPRREKMQARGRKVFLQPDSRSAEAFRTVRTAVFFGAPKDQARTLLVTSPAPGDGKSTVVSNLAIAMAQAGQRTIIVDADFRKPLQQVLFGVNHSDMGIGAVLAGKVKLSKAVQPTQVKGLYLLVAGNGTANPAEVLSSSQFARLLQCLAGAFDRVIVDAPPVTVVTDSQIIGALCDRTILVLQADKSTRKISQRAIDALQSVGARLLGVVVNNVRRDAGRYGYYSTYGGHYAIERAHRVETRPQPVETRSREIRPVPAVRR